MRNSVGTNPVIVVSLDRNPIKLGHEGVFEPVYQDLTQYDNCYIREYIPHVCCVPVWEESSVRYVYTNVRHVYTGVR